MPCVIGVDVMIEMGCEVMFSESEEEWKNMSVCFVFHTEGFRCNGHLISRNEPDAPGELHLTACHLCGASTCNSRQEKNN